jgi:hypothetical protein
LAQYLVRFAAHIVEQTRPKDFPTVVFNDLVVEVDNLRDLFVKTNQHAGSFVGMQCFITLKDQDKPVISPEIESEESFDQRILIPFSMISYIETITKRLTSPVPENGTKVNLA